MKRSFEPSFCSYRTALNCDVHCYTDVHVSPPEHTLHPNCNLPITNGSACLPVNKSALSYYQSTASYLSVTLRWAPSECTRVIKKAAERGGWWWCSWWCHLTCAFACDVRATLEKQTLSQRRGYTTQLQPVAPSSGGEVSEAWQFCECFSVGSVFWH